VTNWQHAHTGVPAKTRKNISENDERLSDVEDKLDDTDVSQSSEGQSSPDEGQESTGQSTALEQVVGLPEETAMNSLSANQKRARSIAKRIDEYGKSVPAGIAITSSRMRDIQKTRECIVRQSSE